MLVQVQSAALFKEVQVKKRIVVAVILAILLGASAYSQTTDLFEIAKAGTLQTIQTALDEGEDVNAREEHGRTALMYAVALKQDPEVIAILLKASADINALDNNDMTPLMFAAVNNSNTESLANDQVSAFLVCHATVLLNELSNLGFHGLGQHLPCSLAGRFLQNATLAPALANLRGATYPVDSP